MKRYYPRGPEGIEMVEDPLGAYVRIEDHEAVIKRQAAAAKMGMDAATAISYHDLQRAHRLNRESSPEALESERSANAILTEENARLKAALARAKNWFSSIDDTRATQDAIDAFRDAARATDS